MEWFTVEVQDNPPTGEWKVVFQTEDVQTAKNFYVDLPDLPPNRLVEHAILGAFP